MSEPPKGQWNANLRERGPGSAAPAGRWVGRGVQPREVGRSRGTEFAKLLTEKQVKMDSVT